MSKSMYSNDIIWYDEGVHNAIVALNEKHPNAIAIFGGALGAYNAIHCDEPDFRAFTGYLTSLIHSAKFFEWHEGIVGALRRFCSLCLVDPMLIELYIGMTLEELCALKA